MKRLVLFVEGDGDRKAVPALVKRILTEMDAWNTVRLDPAPFTVGQVTNLVRNDYADWIRWLKAAAAMRSPLGGILLLLDGDIRRVAGEAFCAKRVAAELAKQARQAGAGSLFSVAVVFACQEYESWLIAGIESLAGEYLPDGIKPPEGDLEVAPRDAKGWLRHCMESRYRPTVHQKSLTERVDLQAIRDRPMRSFRRFESAIAELVTAVRDDVPTTTPVLAEDGQLP
jgi:hypothetical protein